MNVIDNVDRYKTFAGELLRNPDDAENLVNQFALLSDEAHRGNAPHYLFLASRAYAVEPGNINVAFNYGSALSRAGMFEDSVRVYQDCLSIAPMDWIPRVLHDLGVAYRALGDNQKAVEFYDRAIRLDPKQLHYRRDRAIALMAAGKLRDGLEAFEVRREIAAQRLAANQGALVAQQRLPADVVHWQGEPIEGKTITVYHEEGSGDFIQFCRAIPHLREKFKPAKVLLAGPVPDLLELVSDNIPVDGIVPLEGPFASDYVIGSMSLPWRVGFEYSNVDGKPYFRAARGLFPLRGVLNVGLVWRGNPAYGMDVHRSMAFTELPPLFDLAGVAFYSLQVGAAGCEVTHLGFDGFVADLAPFATCWRKTAKLVSTLDVIVSVDTAVAHLAGALGKPVYIMVTCAADWRWDRTSERTAWYDSARVIRQSRQGDWRPCIDRVKVELERLRDERRQARIANQQRRAS